MTERVIIAVTLIAAALAVSITSLICVNRNTEKLISFLEQAEEQYLADEDYSHAIDSAVALWNEKRAVFGILLKHADTDEIDRYFHKMEAYRAAGNADGLFDAAEDCRAALIVMLSGEQPKPGNIF